MSEKNKSELDKLFTDVGKYRKSNEFRELIEFVKKFPKIAPYNAMLVHIQKPGSSYVAPVYEWRNKFGRDIKPGARPLVILRPFGPVAFVYELADTEGDEDFPNELLNPFSAKGKLQEYKLERLIKNIKYDGISYSENNYGTDYAGFIQPNETGKKEWIVEKTKKVLVKILFDIVVNSNHPMETKFATTIHELGHLYCGHLGTFKQKWLNDRRGLDINQREFEAESVCWLVCERMGISNPSAEYLDDYLDNHDRIPNISIDTVLKATAVIESFLNNTNKKRKELIVDVKRFEKTSRYIQQEFEI
jgi:hypothetical protein